MESIKIIKGQEILLKKPQELSDKVKWSTGFLKEDGTLLKNAGYYKLKRELKENEVEGDREAEATKADHLLDIIECSDKDVILKGKNKGNVVVLAKDDRGEEIKWRVEILGQDPKTLPKVLKDDYRNLRLRWKQLLTGTDLYKTEEGKRILFLINKDAEELWDDYIYKGQKICKYAPWKKNIIEEKEISYVDDAIQFIIDFQKLEILCKAYGAEGGKLYKNQELFHDIIHILDFLCGKCYVPKTQTENWWTWEIGMPKALIPCLMILFDDLTKEQVLKYTNGMAFFQLDPFHEGIIGSGSTHGNGYRKGQGANIIDCATISVGLGALREDNELVNLGMMASAETFVIKTIKDSSKIAKNGYESGFYADGSYLDHIKVPYLGAYGIEFMKGAAKIPYLLHEGPWKYPDYVWKNIEIYLIKGFGNAIYKGCMLDCLKGRSVSRPFWSNRDIGREAMKITLRLLDFLTEQGQQTVLPMLKEWITEDAGFFDSLKDVEDLEIKKRARELLEDESNKNQLLPVHKSYPLMDRVIHRRETYLFAVSMHSERIQNTEIMNHENRFGWHQGSGMTYIYDKDHQYTENYWNTVNPFRLAGTTVVPVNIGNGSPDSSGYLQGGDFCSKESWVGGTSIGECGISGMSLSGDIQRVVGDPAVLYAPDLRAKKSWFMFQEEIVCLGAGINNNHMDLPVETTVENKKLRKDGNNEFLINGEKVEIPVRYADVKDFVLQRKDMPYAKYRNSVWAHLEGNNAIGTGYYFPEENTELCFTKGKTSGDWKDIGNFEGKSCQNYLEMWINHGINPKDASYSYVLLPEKTAKETEAYANKPQIVILENTKNVQAVYHKALQILGINFWKENGGSVVGIASDKASSIMLKKMDKDTWKVAVSDPTMKNQGAINIRFEMGNSQISFNMAGKNGESCYMDVKIPSI